MIKSWLRLSQLLSPHRPQSLDSNGIKSFDLFLARAVHFGFTMSLNPSRSFITHIVNHLIAFIPHPKFSVDSANCCAEISKASSYLFSKFTFLAHDTCVVQSTSREESDFEKQLSFLYFNASMMILWNTVLRGRLLVMVTSLLVQVLSRSLELLPEFHLYSALQLGSMITLSTDVRHFLGLFLGGFWT